MNAALPEREQDFWKDILHRCVDCPTEVLDGDEPFSQSDLVDAFQGGILTDSFAFYMMPFRSHQSPEVNLDVSPQSPREPLI